MPGFTGAPDFTSRCALASFSWKASTKASVSSTVKSPRRMSCSVYASVTVGRSLILLYMSDGVGAQLAPIFKKQLKPGSRIVSHRFLMGDWKPEKSETVTGQDGIKYDIHYWIVGK